VEAKARHGPVSAGNAVSGKRSAKLGALWQATAARPADKR